MARSGLRGAARLVPMRYAGFVLVASLRCCVVALLRCCIVEWVKETVSLNGRDVLAILDECKNGEELGPAPTPA